MSLAARRFLSKGSVTHPEHPEQHPTFLESQQESPDDNNLDPGTTVRDTSHHENDRASSSHGLINESDHGVLMVIDSDEDGPSLSLKNHTEATLRPKTRGKVVCQTCQRRKVKCSGQSDQQSIQFNLKCTFCAANGVDCIWKLPKQMAPEVNPRRRANTTGQAGSSQVASTGDRAQTQYRTACMDCRKRKQKCTGERPACQFCAEKQQTCSYEVADGMTRTEDLKHKVQEATERGDKLVKLVCTMQRGTQEESSTLLARLRVGASVDDLLHPESDPNQFPEYIRNGPRGTHSFSDSSTGPTTSPPEEVTPLSTTSSYSFDFSMPPPGLSPADMDQANIAFKQSFPS